MFTAALKKEFTLVFRDLHSLMVLFAMPVMFIIIMSLAMQEQFGSDSELKLGIKIYSADKSPVARSFVQSLSSASGFNFTELEKPLDHHERTQLDDSNRAYLSLPSDLEALLDEDSEEPLSLWLSPKIDARTRLLIEAAIKQELGRSKLQLWLEDDGDDAGISPDAIKIDYIAASDNIARKTPTSVQQSVPAWLIFSMFFVAIPISTTLITERRQGTLARLKSMRVSMPSFLIAKLLPYLAINQIQLLLMLSVGFFAVPLLGGDRLEVPTSISSLIALLLMSLATGVAAVGYALLIAVIAKTTEQATALGGVGNILLGAIGGIMVPKFVMPEYLQSATLVSPMSWSLDGFLNIFLYGYGPEGIISELLGLIAIGLTLFVLAVLLFKRNN